MRAASIRACTFASSALASASASSAVGGGARRMMCARHILYSVDSLLPIASLYAFCIASYSSTYAMLSVPPLRLTSTLVPIAKPSAGGATHRFIALSTLSAGTNAGRTGTRSGRADCTSIGRRLDINTCKMPIADALTTL